MIKLTKEEITAVTVNNIYNSHRIGVGLGGDAQLRKVAEWLDTFKFYEDAMGESGKDFRDLVKRELLKEING